MSLPRARCYTYRLFWNNNHTILLHDGKLTKKQFNEKVAKVFKSMEKQKRIDRYFPNFNDLVTALEQEGFGRLWNEFDADMKEILDVVDEVKMNEKIEH